MRGLAKSSRTDSLRATCSIAVAEGNTPARATGLASTFLMPAGCGLAIPRLKGVPLEQQLWRGEEAAARLAHSFLEAGVADADDWTANHNPFDFLKSGLERWLRKHGEAVIRNQFSLDLLLSTSLDRYFGSDDKPIDASRIFLALEPDSAGYVILGPTLRLLESIHSRLPATFLSLFLGALNRWVSVYDFRSASDRVERLRECYECDPEGGEIELPDIDRCLPKSVKAQRLSRRTLAAMTAGLKNPLARQLLELAIDLDRVSCRYERPENDDEIRELLIDCGEPVPALLAVFERTDPIEGCFDEDCQTMLELTPAPNLVIPFNGETKEGVLGAFTILSTVCETLSCASRLMNMMPGNMRLN